MAAPASSTLTTSDMKGAISQNGVDSINGAAVKICNEHVTFKSLPKGKYTLVGIDIDTTGRRLIDEIIQLAAFTPSDRFGQYIMPYMNLNPAARQRHQVRVISIGFYRMLKSTQTYKIIKSKSEYAALKDFLDWLEALRSKYNSSQGIILVYYEERKFIPYMILESLKKYNLLDRFLNTVKSFVNSLNLVAVKESQHCSLRKLSKHLKDNLSNTKNERNNNVLVPAISEADKTTLKDQQLTEQKKRQKSSLNYDREVFDGNATVRAKLVYEVTLQLTNQDAEYSLESTNAIDKMLAGLQPHVQPIECDISELQVQNKNLERQNSFRPVFLNYFKSTIYHRVRAVKFRIILAERAYDLQSLNIIWSDKKRDGLSEVLQGITELKTEEKVELTDLFDSYFDPDKTIIKPVVKTNIRRQNIGIRNILINKDGNEQGADGDKQGNIISNNLPDSTTKSPKNPRGKRNSRSYHTKNSSKLQTSNIPSDTANQTNKATVPLVTSTATN